MTTMPESAVLFDAAAVQAGIDAVAADLGERCQEGEWLVLCVMQGGLMFTSELLKRLDTALLTLDYIRVTRDRGGTTGGELEFRAAPETPLEGRSVLVLDDIFDEGHTLAAIDHWCRENGAANVVNAVLLDKRHDRKVSGFRPDVAGLTCEDRYVFGFGMDYEGYFRNLPEIRALGANTP